MRPELVTFAPHGVKTYGGDYDNHKKIAAYYNKCVSHLFLPLWRLVYLAIFLYARDYHVFATSGAGRKNIFKEF